MRPSGPRAAQSGKAAAAACSAAQGLAATLTPAYVGVLAHAYGLVMKRVENPEVLRKVCLYWSSTRALSPAAEGFSDFLGPWLTGWAGDVDRLNAAQASMKRTSP